MKKRILILISILIHILAYRYFKMQNRNLVILIFSVLAIIFNNITLAIVLDDLEAKFKRIFLASNSIFLLNITLYSASGFFSDLLLYNQSYKYLNLAIILNFLILNIYLISKLKFKRFIYIPILHIVSCFIAYLTLGLKFNLLINILISIISIFLIFREKKSEDKN